VFTITGQRFGGRSSSRGEPMSAATTTSPIAGVPQRHMLRCARPMRWRPAAEMGRHPRRQSAGDRLWAATPHPLPKPRQNARESSSRARSKRSAPASLGPHPARGELRGHSLSWAKLRRQARAHTIPCLASRRSPVRSRLAPLGSEPRYAEGCRGLRARTRARCGRTCAPCRPTAAASPSGTPRSAS
jgi:hypothetical protein